ADRRLSAPDAYSCFSAVRENLLVFPERLCREPRHALRAFGTPIYSAYCHQRISDVQAMHVAVSLRPIHAQTTAADSKVATHGFSSSKLAEQRTLYLHLLECHPIPTAPIPRALNRCSRPLGSPGDISPQP